MTREPEVALVLTADAWVDALHRHCTDHGGARVRCLVLEPAVALDEEFDVLVASERWPALTRPFVDALHQRGRRVLVVSDTDGSADFVRRIGADGGAPADLGPARLVDAAVGLLPALPVAASGAAAGCPDGRDLSPMSDGATRGTAAFVAVGGPWGAGSTEIALALGRAFLRRGTRPVVVDADVETPSIAVRLGLPLEPNLCAAADAAAYGTGGVPGSVFDLGDDWPVVLVGAPNRHAGAALTGVDVVSVGEALAHRFGPVIFDVSAGVAHGGADDLRSAIVTRSSVLVAVGAADPVGVVRLVEWLDGVSATAPAVTVQVVVNRAPTGRGRRAEIAGEVQRGGRVHGLAFVPFDPRVAEAAWSAALVDRGSFARAVDVVCAAVAVQLDAMAATASSAAGIDRVD